MKLILIQNKALKSINIRIYRAILNSPKTTLGICLAFFIVFAFFAAKLPIDANSDSLILENDKDFKVFQEIIKNS